MIQRSSSSLQSEALDPAATPATTATVATQRQRWLPGQEPARARHQREADELQAALWREYLAIVSKERSP